MLTKAQKTIQVEKAKATFGANETIIFADFTGVPTELIKKLKKDLKKVGGVYTVFRKRLLKIALKEAGFDMDPTQFDAQMATITIPGDLSSAAGVVYAFSKALAKEKKEFKVLGAYDLKGKAFVTAEQFTVIAKLPTREVLLAQVMGAFSGPIRAFMYLLQERGKKMVENPAVPSA